MADLNGDGQSNVIIASSTGYIYILDGTGEALVARHVGRAVRDVAVLPTGGATGAVLVGDANGRIVIVGLDREEKVWQAPAGVTRVAGVDAGAVGLAVAATVEGELVAYGR